MSARRRRYAKGDVCRGQRERLLPAMSDGAIDEGRHRLSRLMSGVRLMADGIRVQIGLSEMRGAEFAVPGTSKSPRRRSRPDIA